jgi:hypothetical protein
MKSTTFALSAFLASVAIAQPHAHQAFHNHEKRDDAIVWVTEIETATDIVDVTTTIWVSAGFVAPTIASSASTTSVTPVAAQFFQAASSSATTLSTSTYVAPTPSTVAVTSTIATTSSVAPVVVAAVATTPVAVVSSSAAPIVAVATTAASTSDSSTVAGVTTGTCDGKSNTCAGDITYYDTGYPGYGACGDQTDGTKVAVIALPWEFMGTLSNSNPYCHRNVSIQYKGVSITAMVVDKCMGCTGRSIDLSHFAFDQLADEAIGRTQATWYFLD